ncbi:MAG TPA: DSD1 family PLP-dependent enzyme [Bryobacteraceae bacterium]|nr:DSD1 family PLP-dependent enzyme [Bryobacteraceae bacterium]
MNIADLPTPALLLDVSLFERNIQRMATHMARAGKRLRPHAKAHKCAAIAQHQIRAGADGICVATVSEAELMVSSGVEDVLLTSPVATSSKCGRMAALADVARVSVVVDHPDQVRLYADAAKSRGTRLNVLVDLDVGDHRTGSVPGQPAVDLAGCIVRETALTFAGLQAYSVRASHLSAADGVAEYTAAALQHAADTRRLLERIGMSVPVITGGSTGTYAFDSQLEQVDELQPGSYALMDVAYARIGLTEFDHALTVLATVVSANHRDRVTVDAGFKAFATDRAFGPDVQGLEGARHQWAGDEFSFVLLDDSPQRPRLGDRLRFIPPHCDPTVNLYDRMYACSGDIVVDTWSIMDRYRAN